jgi:hypothetical protein
MKVEPVEVDETGARPYIVKIDGWTVTDKAGRPKRFKDSIAAAIGGAKHIDWLRVHGLLASPASGEVKP